MINLLPPAARIGVQREYWVRVATVWLLLLSGAFALASLIMLPTYVLITSQVSVYRTSAEEIAAEVASYEDVSTNLIRANQQAAFLADESTLTSFSELITLFHEFESQSITISKVRIGRTGVAVEQIVLEGTALDRQALAQLRDALLAAPEIAEVELPISNLARGANIPFVMTVTLNTKSSV